MNRMSKIIDISTQNVIFICGYTIIFILSEILAIIKPEAFERFLPFKNIPVVLVLIFLFAGVSLFLLKKKSFSIYKKKNKYKIDMQKILVSIILGITIIIVDINCPYPEDMNISLPFGLIFYPIIGLIVDLLLHIIPFAIICCVIHPIENQKLHRYGILFGIMTISLLEPIYQVIHGFKSGNPVWMVVYTGFHVCFINLYQFFVYKQQNFVEMYRFRMYYYFIWHILWGYFRLYILF